MKKIYSTLLFIFLAALSQNLKAQCSSCTITITGMDAANHIVNSGTTLCITASGTATGLITVASGGTLCNLGNINSTEVWVAGGTLNNFGAINSENILVSGQGVFNNNGTAAIDSLLVTNIYSTFTNNGTLTGMRLGNSDYSSIINNGSITEDYVGDSLSNFTNNTSGSLVVNYDFGNGYNSGFYNYGYFKVTRDFYNGNSATFETSCMAIVSRDWYNSAIISVPSIIGCAGFYIAGGSYNSGTIGSASSHVDLCDAGNPPWGIDGPGGTIASTTTYCACTNNCVVITGLEALHESDVIIENLYPNPASNEISVMINSKSTEVLSVEAYDMMGRKKLSCEVKSAIGENKFSLDLSGLAQGTYILKIIDSQKMQSKQMFNVEK
jgi:hypothetical protein